MRGQAHSTGGGCFSPNPRARAYKKGAGAKPAGQKTPSPSARRGRRPGAAFARHGPAIPALRRAAGGKSFAFWRSLQRRFHIRAARRKVRGHRRFAPTQREGVPPRTEDKTRMPLFPPMGRFGRAVLARQVRAHCHARPGAPALCLGVPEARLPERLLPAFYQCQNRLNFIGGQGNLFHHHHKLVPHVF